MSVYKECDTCLMNNYNNEEILFFDKECSFCMHAKNRIHREKITNDFEDKIENIKKVKSNKYDCIIGLSGGVDSSYLAHIAFINNLNPLIVHVDNGWNTNTAVTNIEKIVKKTGFKYISYVIDWNIFREMQKIYLKASVINVEVLTDHAITAVLYKFANKYGIKNILTGSNLSTESIMPTDWSYDYRDSVNIKSILKSFGLNDLRNYPILGLLEFIYYIFFKKIKFVTLLNNIEYNSINALRVLEDEYNYEKYRFKHGESSFTDFYQNYYLIEKFNIDKKLAHLSSQIVSGIISKNEAKQKINNIKNFDHNKIKYILEKLDISQNEFSKILKSEKVDHKKYKNIGWIFDPKKNFLLDIVKKFAKNS